MVRYSALLSYNIDHVSYALAWLSHTAWKHATQLAVDLVPLGVHRFYDGRWKQQ